jgi:hypothetical protein
MKNFKLEYYKNGYVTNTEYKDFECSALAYDYARIKISSTGADMIRVYSSDDWDYFIDIKND